MVIVSSQWNRKEYYEKQARDLRYKAMQAQKQGDINEASRLTDLAVNAEEKARGIAEQIRAANES